MNKIFAATLALLATPLTANAEPRSMQVECLPRAEFEKKAPTISGVDTRASVGLTSTGMGIVTLWKGPDGQFVVTMSLTTTPDIECVVVDGIMWRDAPRAIGEGPQL